MASSCDQSAATWCAGYLRRRGVRHAFGLERHTRRELTAALDEAGIEVVRLHSAAAAARAASAAGMITGLPGICLTADEPDSPDLLAGASDAWLDRAPLLVVVEGDDSELADGRRSGRPPAGEGVFKDSSALEASSLTAVLPRAFELAMAEPCGPVRVTFRRSEARRAVEVQPEEPAEAGPSPDASQTVDRVLEKMNLARRPALLIGLGVRLMEWERELVRLATSLGGPVLVTPAAKGHFPEDHPLFAGIHEAGRDRPTTDLLREADLLVGVGLSPMELAGRGDGEGPAVSLTTGLEAEGGFPGFLSAPLEDQAALGRVTARLRVRSAWPAGSAAATRRAVAALLARSAGTRERGASPLAVLRELRSLVRREAIVVCDGGPIRRLATQGWQAYWPRTFLTPAVDSASGRALPAALAARLTCPDRQVVCLTDSGGLLACSEELGSLARLGLGVLIVAWTGLGSAGQAARESAGRTEESGRPGDEADVANLARSRGIWSATIERAEEIAGCLRAAIARPSPALVQVPAGGLDQGDRFWMNGHSSVPRKGFDR